MSQKIDFFDLTNPKDMSDARRMVDKALMNIIQTPQPLQAIATPVITAAQVMQAAPIAPAMAPMPPRQRPVVTPNPDLLGFDPSIYALINQALAVKRHIMFYGPPGTGKTSLAEHVAAIINNSDYKMVTGTADWASQDIIGGYQPTGQGKLKFMPGLILEHFDKPIVIDELNRVDIDKAIGPLFTVLSGQETTLPYQLEPDSSDPGRQQRVHILPLGEVATEAYQFVPTEDWRLIATINSLDKASLYQMSYALSRRFAWILIDVPQDLNSFVREYLEKRQFLLSAPAQGVISVLSEIWAAVNLIRPIGAAAFIDVIQFCHVSNDQFDFFKNNLDESDQRLYLDGFYTFVLPLLDGILQGEAEIMIEKILTALGLNVEAPLALQLKKRVTYHSI